MCQICGRSAAVTRGTPLSSAEACSGGYQLNGASPMAQLKSLLAVQEMQEAWVQSLGREDPLEEDMATHSSVLAWRIPWTEEPAGLQPVGSQRVRHD